MSKEDLIEFDGVVMEMLPDSRFLVKLDNGHETLAYTAALAQWGSPALIATIDDATDSLRDLIGAVPRPTAAVRRP